MGQPSMKSTPAGKTTDDPDVELSSRRTGMSFQRTRMSAERTLMTVLRTSLSMISFGFTIYSFFGHLQGEGLLKRQHAPRNFGLALLTLGVAILIAGIGFHISFMRELRHERIALAEEGLIHAKTHFPVSYTLLTAVMLLLIGLTAIVSIVFDIGPFG